MRSLLLSHGANFGRDLARLAGDGPGAPERGESRPLLVIVPFEGVPPLYKGRPAEASPDPVTGVCYAKPIDAAERGNTEPER